MVDVLKALPAWDTAHVIDVWWLFADKRALYVVSTSDVGPQIYELVTSSKDERTKYIEFLSVVLPVSAFHFCAHLTSLDRTVLLTSVHPSICLSVKCVYCDKTKACSKKSSIMTSRKLPTSFPMSRRWTAYVAPKPPIRLLWKFWFARWRALRTCGRTHTTITCLTVHLLSHCLSYWRSTPKWFNIKMPFAC